MLSQFLVTILFAAARAHIQMTYPPPINSQYDPQTPQADIDYSMTSPLASNGQGYGSAFPCKGYATADKIASLNPVATLTTGQFITTQLTGSATHGGGSCQYSVSTDGGATFVVIHSVIGGCPIGLTHTFPIPSDLPATDKALFAWSWFNEIGNREMYMDCAVVSIASTTGATSHTGPRLFRANTFGNGQCIAVEGQDVVFPNPGPSVEYGGSMSAASPVTNLSPCDYDEDVNVTITGDGTVSTSPDPSTTSSDMPSPTDDATATSTLIYPTTTTDNVPPTSSPTGSPPTDGTSSYIQCETETTWSLCDAATCTFMGSVAPGTYCVNGQMVASGDDSDYSDTTTAVSSSDSITTSTITLSPTTDSMTMTSTSAPTSISSDSIVTSTDAMPPATRTTTINSPTSTAGPAPSTFIMCNSASTFSLCSDASTCTFMGSVAPGTTCTNGQIVSAADTPSTAGPPLSYNPQTGIRCDTLTTWSLCSSADACTPMGQTAPGTICENGEMVAARFVKRIRRRGC